MAHDTAYIGKASIMMANKDKIFEKVKIVTVDVLGVPTQGTAPWGRVPVFQKLLIIMALNGHNPT